MININTFYCNTYNGTKSNVGDILTPYIFNTQGINTIHSETDSKLYAIGSLFEKIPDNYCHSIWSTGFLLQPRGKKTLMKSPYAVRGKYTLSNLHYDNSPMVLGDGGLLLETFYKPVQQSKYKLGIIPHYVDLDWSTFDIKLFTLFSSPDVLFIDVKNDVETFTNKVNSCQNIISSSLHGLVISDSYGINNGIFMAQESQKSLHDLKGSYKFKDYYSTFNQSLPGILKLTDKTTLEECLSHCREFNKSNMQVIKKYLHSSLMDLKEYLKGR